MSLSPIKETQGLMLYVFCVLLTSALITIKPLWGVLTIMWGFIGFYRYLYLNSARHIKMPKILTLPSRILFDVSQEQKIAIDNTIERFLKFDIVMLVFLGVIFTAWGMYCSLNPVELEIFQIFLSSKKDILQPFPNTNIYNIAEQISFYFMMALIVFVGLTYAMHNNTHNQTQGSSQKKFTHIFHILFLLPIAALLVYIIVMVPFSGAGMDMRFSHLKGIGWGQFAAFQSLVGGDLSWDSGFIRRYVETGLIGAIGFYVLLLPFILTFMRSLIWSCRTVRRAILLCLTLCGALIALDFFWFYTPWMQSLLVLIVAYITFFFGRIGRFTQKA